MGYSRKILDAFALMYELHGDQLRKQTEIPYYTHPMAVAAVVAERGGNEEQFIAALLHDAVEDQGGETTLALIRERFGERIAELVAGCSDSFSTPKPPWRERKDAFLARIRQATPDVRLIVAADKLHNARSILNDLHEHGDRIWSRFKAGKDGSLWYYGEIVRALSDGWSHPILRELSETIDEVQRKASSLEQRNA